MKSRFTVFLILYGSLNIFAQNKSDLIGTWSVESALNEDGEECSDEIKSAFKLSFLADGTYLKEEFSWNSKSAIKSNGTYDIIDNSIRLSFMIGAFMTTHTYQIITSNEERLIVTENLCPVRDEISNPQLILIRTE